MANSAKVLERGTDGAAFEALIPASSPGDTFPAGTVLDYAGTAAPTGWLLCDGSSVATATYPNLFAAVGYTYGGAGANFNLPDSRGRVHVGKHASGTFQTLGATGGEETHVLSVGEMPSHNHGGATGSTAPSGSTDTHAGHTHTGDRVCGVNGTSGSVITNVISGTAGNWQVMQTPNALTGGAHSHGVSVNSHAHSVSAQGGGGAHNNLQPYIVLNKIIRAN